MKQLHIVTQSKGGAGKSFIANLLTQYIAEGLEQGKTFKAFDTDPLNHSLASFSALPVEIVSLVNEQGLIDKSRFDAVMENIITNYDVALLDTGSSSFLETVNYFVENHIVESFESEGYKVVFHVPVIGGNEFDHCLQSLETVANKLNGKTIVWINEGRLGKIPFSTPLEFLASPVMKKVNSKIIGIVQLVEESADTTGRDIGQMMNEKLTFEEVKTSPQFSMFPRRRLADFKERTFSKIDAVMDIALSATKASARSKENEAAK